MERRLATQKVSFVILRYEPTNDGKPRYQTYSLEVNLSDMVINALDNIHNNIDASLTYRHSCHHGVCGSCVARINGIEKIMCKTPISEVVNRRNRVILEPMKNFRVIRDLVVDLDPFFKKLGFVKPALVGHVPLDKEIPHSPKNVKSMIRYESCIECGACYSACPIVSTDPDYLGPGALVAAYRTCVDDRDKGKSARLRLVDNEEGCWRCHSIFNCVDVCPKDVRPASAIAGLRRMITSEKLAFWRRRKEQ